MEGTSPTARFWLPDPPPPAPELVTATYTTANGRVHLTFDQDLVDGPFAPANFRAWDGLNERVITGAIRILPNVVRLLTSAGPVSAGPARTSYLASPPELVSLATGEPVAAYSDFPLAVS